VTAPAEARGSSVLSDALSLATCHLVVFAVQIRVPEGLSDVLRPRRARSGGVVSSRAAAHLRDRAEAA